MCCSVVFGVTLQASSHKHFVVVSRYQHRRLLLAINVKNFLGSLTTVVRAQNDTSKTANITDTIFDRTLV